MAQTREQSTTQNPLPHYGDFGSTSLLSDTLPMFQRYEADPNAYQSLVKRGNLQGQTIDARKDPEHLASEQRLRHIDALNSRIYGNTVGTVGATTFGRNGSTGSVGNVSGLDKPEQTHIANDRVAEKQYADSQKLHMDKRDYSERDRIKRASEFQQDLAKQGAMNEMSLSLTQQLNNEQIRHMRNTAMVDMETAVKKLESEIQQDRTYRNQAIAHLKRSEELKKLGKNDEATDYALQAMALMQKAGVSMATSQELSETSVQYRQIMQVMDNLAQGKPAMQGIGDMTVSSKEGTTGIPNKEAKKSR